MSVLLEACESHLAGYSIALLTDNSGLVQALKSDIDFRFRHVEKQTSIALGSQPILRRRKESPSYAAPYLVVGPTGSPTFAVRCPIFPSLTTQASQYANSSPNGMVPCLTISLSASVSGRSNKWDSKVPWLHFVVRSTRWQSQVISALVMETRWTSMPLSVGGAFQVIAQRYVFAVVVHSLALSKTLLE